MKQNNSNQSVPIYCIDNFQNYKSKEKPQFEIKRVQDIVRDFDFANRPHRHNFYDILYIKQGKGTHSIDFNTYEVKPNSLFFVMPGQVHTWQLSEDIEGYSIFFTQDFFLLNRPMTSLNQLPYFQHLHNNPVLYLDCPEFLCFADEICQKIYQEQEQQQPFRNEIVRLYIELLLAKISRIQITRTHYYKNVSHLQQQAFHYQELLEENFLVIRSIQEYADLMSVSPKHLNVICKKVFGKTARDVLHERIILETKRLLIYSNDTIGQLAQRLGFNEVSYFVRFFRKMTNTTPEVFRKEYQQM
jgi:AraC family transcriptional regulator, transcriptional activator of pobA